MGDVLKNKKTLGAVALIIAAAAALYYFLWRPAASVPEAAPALSGSGALQGAGTPDGELVSLILQFQMLSIERAFFDDAAFRSLEDFSVPLVKEPVGRRNPFAPFPGGGAGSSGTGAPRP